MNGFRLSGERTVKRAVLLLTLSAFLGACNSNTPPATATPTPVVIVPTPIVIVATQAPPATPVPSATPAVNVGALGGSWGFFLDYWLSGYPVYSEIHYSGSATLTITPTGSLSGKTTLNTTLFQLPCAGSVPSGSSLDATLSGQVVLPTAPNALPLADLTITPLDTNARQSFSLACADSSLSDTQQVSIFWQALAATGQLHIQFPLQRGVAYE